MSIIVKGMSMPKGCNKCDFCSGYMTGQARILGYVCLASLEKEDSVRGRRKIEELCFLCRPDWCPLVELPEKHGRLIDADELWKKMSIYTDNEGAKFPFGDDDSIIHRDSACFMIECADTIVEAEGVEE